MKPSILPIAATALALLTSCDRGPFEACTEMGCGAVIAVEVQSDAWEDGAYSIAFSIGDSTENCTFDVPFDDATASCDGVTMLTLGDDLTLEYMRGMTEDTPLVEIVVEHEGATLIDSAVEIAWDAPYYPNGEKCDDAGCVGGQGSISMP